jgi:mannosyltransferase OCH1-like enzyme
MDASFSITIHHLLQRIKMMDQHQTSSSPWESNRGVGARVIYVVVALIMMGMTSFASQRFFILPVIDYTRTTQASEQSELFHYQSRTRKLTLPEITRSNDTYACPEGLVYVRDTVLHDYDSQHDRKIPRIVHITAKSRCLTPAFAENVEKWRLRNHSLFFHDDFAVDRFISQSFSLFPHFQNVMKCITSGAAKADLWRYLIIFEFGGIYTDFDNAPQEKFQEGNAITPTDDAWFPLEALGVVAQYFFAASPQHPIMYTSLHSALMAIWQLESIQNNKAPYTTGPRATKNGFIEFMKAVGKETDGYIPAGIYVGMNNRSITVVGDKNYPHEFVHRGGVAGKQVHYQKMGMVHFSKQRGIQRHSCSQHIYYEYVKTMNQSLNNGYSTSSAIAPVMVPIETIDCGCSNTCNGTVLEKRRMGLTFTCQARIEYLMNRYGDSQPKACSGAVKLGACGPECDPDICSGR